MPDQNIQQSTPGSYLKLLTVIYSALFAGQLLFAVLVFMLKNSTIIDFKNTRDPFLFVVPFMALGAIIGGNFLFKKTLTEATGKETLKQKLMVYQTAVIIKSALLEGPSWLGIFVYIQTSNFLYLIISGVLMLYFLTQRPTKDKIENDLNLSYEDKIQFDSADTPL